MTQRQTVMFLKCILALQNVHAPHLWGKLIFKTLVLHWEFRCRCLTAALSKNGAGLVGGGMFLLPTIWVQELERSLACCLGSELWSLYFGREWEYQNGMYLDSGAECSHAVLCIVSFPGAVLHCMQVVYLRAFQDLTSDRSATVCVAEAQPLPEIRSSLLNGMSSSEEGVGGGAGRQMPSRKEGVKSFWRYEETKVEWNIKRRET